MNVTLKRIVFAVIICVFASVNVYADDVKILINGKEISTDTPPIIENDRTLVPVRGIFEHMSARVEWDFGTVKIKSGKDEIILTVGESEFLFNGEEKLLDVPVKIADNRVYIPLRAVSELLECSVNWNEKERSVEIFSNERLQEDGYLLEYEVFLLVNEIRRASKMKEFLWDEDLAKVGRSHAKDMYVKNYFDHQSPDGKTPFERMSQGGVSYTHAAENIARDFDSADAVIDSWMNSEAHRANILNPVLTRLGVGYYGGYWCQEFAN